MTMTDTWESLFKECAVENNHTEKYLKECFEYAGSLHQRNLPVIFDFVHLAMYFECCAETLKGMGLPMLRNIIQNTRSGKSLVVID